MTRQSARLTEAIDEPRPYRRTEPGRQKGTKRWRATLPKRTAGRHLIVIVVGLLTVAAFAAVHQEWSPMHRWNRAAADASIVLLALTMALGPLARLWPAWSRLLPLRRELGIYAMLLALAHTIIILAGWVEWNFARLFGLELHPGLGRYVMVQHGFGLANLIGILALGYGVVLVATSNNRAVRALGGQVWKFVQFAAYVLWVLVVVHTAYFLFMHFVDFHRPTPPPNPLSWPFAVLVVLVLVLRWSATVRTWRLRALPERQRGTA